MIKIFGPENRQQYISVSPDGNVFTPTEGTPLLANATTLNEAIRAYENEHAISIEPYDGSFEAIPFNEGENPKYFSIASHHQISSWSISMSYATVRKSVQNRTFPSIYLTVIPSKSASWFAKFAQSRQPTCIFSMSKS